MTKHRRVTFHSPYCTLPELEELSESNPERAGKLIQHICTQLQSFSLEGDMACLIDDNVYGVMHGDEVAGS